MILAVPNPQNGTHMMITRRPALASNSTIVLSVVKTN